MLYPKLCYNELSYNEVVVKIDCTIYVVKTKVLISCAVTAQLICTFVVFAYVKTGFSHDMAHMRLDDCGQTLLLLPYLLFAKSDGCGKCQLEEVCLSLCLSQMQLQYHELIHSPLKHK